MGFRSETTSLSGRPGAGEAEVLWKATEVGEPRLPVSRVSFDSPLELVITFELGAAGAVTAFALIVSAIKRVYMNVRSFEVEDARLDALIAEYQAANAASKLSAEQSRAWRGAITTDAGELTPTSERDITMDRVEVTIDED